jgi:hypothetical protein
MEALSVLALILLSMFSYSAGAVSSSALRAEPKPRWTDLFFVLVIWAGAIWTRSAFGWNKWLLILAWLVPAFLAGRFAWLKRSKKLTRRQDGPKKLWPRWRAFSRRTGGFQSRLILSFFFFLAAAPFGLAIKIFRDPLRLRKGNQATYWLAKKETADDLEQSRRQF